MADSTHSEDEVSLSRSFFEDILGDKRSKSSTSSLLTIHPTQLFESLRKQVPPEKLEAQQKDAAEAQAAQNAKAQERLADLV